MVGCINSTLDSVDVLFNAILMLGFTTEECLLVLMGGLPRHSDPTNSSGDLSLWSPNTFVDLSVSDVRPVPRSGISTVRVADGPGVTARINIGEWL
jgi:hypothetical protein